jgi:multicomponent Na+:H+ antiporter subunit G
MAIVLNLISWGLLAVGGIMMIIGAIGMIRLPDVFARMHGAGIVDTLGLGAIMAGLMIQGGLTIVTVKLGLIVLFIAFTGPTATHALARAALHGGVTPQVDDPDTDPDVNVQGDASSKT